MRADHLGGHAPSESRQGNAAPVLGRDDVVAGAIGLVGPADRLLAVGTRDNLVRAVVTAGRAVSRDLGAGRGGVSLSAL